jgi:hypothetical protein
MVFYTLADKNANKDENPRPGEETFVIVMLLSCYCHISSFLIYSLTFISLVQSEALDMPDQLDDTLNECFNSEQGTTSMYTKVVLCSSKQG